MTDEEAFDIISYLQVDETSSDKENVWIYGSVPRELWERDKREWERGKSKDITQDDSSVHHDPKVSTGFGDKVNA